MSDGSQPKSAANASLSGATVIRTIIGKLAATRWLGAHEDDRQAWAVTHVAARHEPTVRCTDARSARFKLLAFACSTGRRIVLLSVVRAGPSRSIASAANRTVRLRDLGNHYNNVTYAWRLRARRSHLFTAYRAPSLWFLPLRLFCSSRGSPSKLPTEC